MDKPEKKEILRGYNDYVSDYEHGCDSGWNSAIDDYETWLKEAMSVDKIQKIMYKTEDDYELGETNSLHIAIAKAIHKLIGR